MKHETFESALRSTWQLVSKMYNKEALKFDSTMATGFALLSIDAKGTQLIWAQKWEWNPLACQDY